MEIGLSLTDFLLVTPALALFFASIIPLFMKVIRNNVEQNSFATMIYGLVGVVAAAGLVTSTRGVRTVAMQGALVFDGTTVLASLAILFLTALTLTVSRENLNTQHRQFSEVVFLILNSVIGLLTVLWSNDLVTTFVGIEVMSLCFYIMIAVSGEDRLSKEAAFKYFLLGSFASAIFLYGIALLYGTLGSTHLSVLAQSAELLGVTNRLYVIGIVMTIIGLLFKVSIFPFHAWTPDVYQGAPTPISGFMASTTKLVTFVFLIRLFDSGILLNERSGGLVNAIQWIAAFSMLLGNAGALMQTSLKRMLAYSSIGHAGYLLMGLLASAVVRPNPFGDASVLFYIITYAVVTLGAFAVVSVLEEREESVVLLSDLRGLSHKHPILAILMSIFLLSMAGIPPLVGFFGKLFVFTASLSQGFVWLTIWAVISSIVGVYVYLKPMVLMFMEEREEQRDSVALKPLSLMSIFIVAVFAVVLGLASESLLSKILQIVS